MLSEDDLKALAVPLRDKFTKLEKDIILLIVRKIKKIGALTESDMHKLIRLKNIGYDLEEINKDIEDLLSESKKEIFNVFSYSIQEDYNDSKTSYESIGKKFIPFKENKEVQELIKSIAKVTRNEFKNITETTGFVNTKGKWKPLAEYYSDTLDYAVIKTRLGTEDFYTAMRKTVKNMTDYGLTHIEYESGYRRRVDSSVFSAMMGGQSRLSREMAKINGEKFGADGMEITWHSGARPSHVFMGGQQYNMDTFENIIVPLLDEYNCYHRARPIILGISEPAYTQEEIDRLNEKDAVKKDYGGKQFNKYEAFQKQRQFERAIRKEKDRAEAFKELGDTESYKKAKTKISVLNYKYKDFSDKMEIRIKPKRTVRTKYKPRTA